MQLLLGRRGRASGAVQSALEAPVVEWGTIPSQRVQYEDFVIVSEKSKDPKVVARFAHMSVSACRPSESEVSIQ